MSVLVIASSGSHVSLSHPTKGTSVPVDVQHAHREMPQSTQPKGHLPVDERVTVAIMTDHKLTTAHLFSHRPLDKLSPEMTKESKHG